MTAIEMFPKHKPYGMFAFWMLHTLMLVIFLLLALAGFQLLVSNLFYYVWIAIWIFHGFVVMLWLRDREVTEDQSLVNNRLWRRIVLGAHSALYVALGPVVLLSWLTTRPHVLPQEGEVQSLWVYPVWLMLLLIHAGYVMIRDKQAMPTVMAAEKRNHKPSPNRLMEVEPEVGQWDDNDEAYYQKNKR